jgi:hypothetical protein
VAVPTSTKLVYSTQTTLSYEIGNLAGGKVNDSMMDFQRATLSSTDTEYGERVVGSQIQVGIWSSYSTLMVVLKLAMSFFYRRLTVMLPRSSTTACPSFRKRG